MYTLPQFRNHDADAIKSFLHANGFAVLVSLVEGKLWASHIPLQLSDDGNFLYGHLSKGNKQWKSFTSGEEVLAVFNGPHTYISSSWYDHENVPTWNYIAVHVYGTVRVITGEELYGSLQKLVAKYEAKSKQPVSMEKMSQPYVKREMQGVTGFEIAITGIEAAYKLSQNRDETNHQLIIDALQDQGDHNALEIAQAMKNNRPKPSKHE